jgi:hypothetical protein
MLVLRASILATLVAVLWPAAHHLHAQVLVPGTGRPVAGVGDDFEDEKWEYVFNNPKSTQENNKQDNDPVGQSKNGRWYEGIKRGQPDVVRRVPTPEGGLAGSKGSLLLRTVYSGIPGRPSYHMQQDDLIADVNYKLGGAISVERSPSVVTRVYLPPFEKWEQRTGCTFAFRAATEAYTMKRSGSGLFASAPKRTLETYWIGFFVDFRPDPNGDHSKDVAILRIRGDESGQDVPVLTMNTTGWWTLGMSFTPDGRVHYFARPDVKNLKPENRIASQTCYGLRMQSFKTFFFNVCSADDGKTWSTAWIVDDPTVYVAR